MAHTAKSLLNNLGSVIFITLSWCSASRPKCRDGDHAVPHVHDHETSAHATTSPRSTSRHTSKIFFPIVLSRDPSTVFGDRPRVPRSTHPQSGQVRPRLLRSSPTGTHEHPCNPIRASGQGIEEAATGPTPRMSLRPEQTEVMSWAAAATKDPVLPAHQRLLSRAGTCRRRSARRTSPRRGPAQGLGLGWPRRCPVAELGPAPGGAAAPTRHRDSVHGRHYT